MNKQEPQAVLKGDGQALDIHSMFYTIQGEGPFRGHPAVFIRLAGCNLQCPGCDTEYTQGAMVMWVEDIVERALALFSPQHLMRRLVVITGGEPFRQNILPLIEQLQTSLLTVQIETNGTLPPPPGMPRQTIVVCSPKAGKVNPELKTFITSYKYVLRAGSECPVDGLPLDVLGKDHSPARPHDGWTGHVYVSPMDEQDDFRNQANIDATVQSCMKHGYLFNPQIHKLACIP